MSEEGKSASNRRLSVLEPKLPGLKKMKGDDDKDHEEKIQQIKLLIIDIYKEHNPTKLDDVDGLMAKYKGKQENLYQVICEKYKVEPKLPRPSPEDAATGDTSGAASTSEGPAGESSIVGMAAPPGAGGPTYIHMYIYIKIYIFIFVFILPFIHIHTFIFIYIHI